MHARIFLPERFRNEGLLKGAVAGPEAKILGEVAAMQRCILIILLPCCCQRTRAENITDLGSSLCVLPNGLDYNHLEPVC